MSFYERFEALCVEKGVKPSRAASDCGIHRSNVTSWKVNGYTPRGDALQKLADYFGVTSDYLLGNSDKENPPALTKKDRRDIAKDLEMMLAQLDAGDDLMFNGDPMSEEAKESIRAAMKLGMEAAKLKNKERFGRDKG